MSSKSLLVFVIIVFGLSTGCINIKDQAKSKKLDPDFIAYLEDKPTVIYFGNSKACYPCKLYEPIWLEVKKSYIGQGINFVEVIVPVGSDNTNKVIINNKETGISAISLANKFGVRGVPLTLTGALKEDVFEIEAKKSGYMGKKALEDLIDSLLRNYYLTGD